MIELPDVGLLFAMLDSGHEHFRLARRWFDAVDQFATTPITEMGLIRLLMNPKAATTPLAASAALSAMSFIKNSRGANFWIDTTPFDQNSRFSYALTGYRQITDLHLLEIAVINGGVLTTLDSKIKPALRPVDRKYVKPLVT